MMRSAQAFCHGDRGAVRTVCVFIPAMVVATSAKPNHDRGQDIAALGLRKSIARRCAVQAAVGCSVTAT